MNHDLEDISNPYRSPDFYRDFLQREEANVGKMLQLVYNLGLLELSGRNWLTFTPALIKHVLRTAQELVKVTTKLGPIYDDLWTLRKLKRELLDERIGNKEVKVVGVWIHDPISESEVACFRCISRLKNSDGSPFRLEQASEEDLILDTDKSEIARDLEEKGCNLCNLDPTPEDEIDDGVREHSPYCNVCGRPVVYV